MIPPRKSTLIVAIVLLIGSTSRAGYFDSINPAATPPPDTKWADIVYAQGWYYTPSQSYTLTGISSFFNPDPDFGSHSSQTLTVQIQTDRPAVGGTLLDQGTFSGVPATGGTLGATFSSGVSLQAGTTYFVDFLGIGGMGINLGQWVDNGSGVHLPSNGATTRLAVAYIADNVDATFPDSDARVGNHADGNPGNGNVSDLEPILYFSGYAAVPEPGSVIMLGTGCVGLVLYRSRRPGRRRRDRRADWMGPTNAL